MNWNDNVVLLDLAVKATFWICELVLPSCWRKKMDCISRKLCALIIYNTNLKSTHLKWTRKLGLGAAVWVNCGCASSALLFFRGPALLNRFGKKVKPGINKHLMRRLCNRICAKTRQIQMVCKCCHCCMEASAAGSVLLQWMSVLSASQSTFFEMHSHDVSYEWETASPSRAAGWAFM